MLRKPIFFIVVFLMLIYSAPIFASDSDISILQCDSNAIANRDYYFNKKEWMGKDDKPSDEFRTGNKAKPNGLIMRSKIFVMHFPRNSGHTERLGYNRTLKP